MLSRAISYDYEKEMLTKRKYKVSCSEVDEILCKYLAWRKILASIAIKPINIHHLIL